MPNIFWRKGNTAKALGEAATVKLNGPKVKSVKSWSFGVCSNDEAFQLRNHFMRFPQPRAA